MDGLRIFADECGELPDELRPDGEQSTVNFSSIFIKQDLLWIRELIFAG
jgi:hypothetical protein